MSVPMARIQSYSIHTNAIYTYTKHKYPGVKNKSCENLTISHFARSEYEAACDLAAGV